MKYANDVNAKTRWLAIIITALGLGLSLSCQRIALTAMANALAHSGSGFGSDDDPALIENASPFALKTMQTLADELPDHAPIQLATCANFTQYAYAFVSDQAAMAPSVSEQKRLNLRARKLFLRARRYCLQALRITDKNALRAFETGQEIGSFKAEHAGLLYWTAASWALAATADKEQLDMIGDLKTIERMLHKALALDADYDQGALHEFMITFDGARSETMGGSPARARAAFQRAVALSQGRKAAPFVALAENVSVAEQNSAEFETLLKQALAVSLDAAPQYRLANIIAQRRAAYLLAHQDDFFIGN